jgi:hypothetical protein
MSKTFTFSDVSEHTTKKDLYMVIHDKVYDTSSFVDEHPYVSLFSPLSNASLLHPCAGSHVKMELPYARQYPLCSHPRRSHHESAK